MAKIIRNETIIQRAYDELDRLNWDEEELTAYEAAIKKQMDYEADMEQKHDEGKAEGRMEEKILIAKKMLVQNISIGAIAELTELTMQQIKELTTA